MGFGWRWLRRERHIPFNYLQLFYHSLSRVRAIDHLAVFWSFLAKRGVGRAGIGYFHYCFVPGFIIPESNDFTVGMGSRREAR